MAQRGLAGCRRGAARRGAVRVRTRRELFAAQKTSRQIAAPVREKGSGGMRGRKNMKRNN